MENIVICPHCGAKMRIKPAALKIVKEVQCAKCRKSVPIPPGLKDAAKKGTISPRKETVPSEDPQSVSTSRPPKFTTTEKTSASEPTTPPAPEKTGESGKKVSQPAGDSISGVQTKKLEERIMQLESQLAAVRRRLDNLINIQRNEYKSTIEKLEEI